MSKIKARLNVISSLGDCTTAYDEYTLEELDTLKAKCILAANGGMDNMELSDPIGTIIIIPKNILMNSVFTIESKIND